MHNDGAQHTLTCFGRKKATCYLCTIIQPDPGTWYHLLARMWRAVYLFTMYSIVKIKNNDQEKTNHNQQPAVITHFACFLNIATAHIFYCC